DPGRSRSEVEPFGAVDFREGLLPPASWRPFDLERVAADVSCVDVDFDGECGDGLAAALLHLAEWRHLAGQLDTKLFCELPARDVLGVLAGAKFAFWYR